LKPAWIKGFTQIQVGTWGLECPEKLSIGPAILQRGRKINMTTAVQHSTEVRKAAKAPPNFDSMPSTGFMRLPQVLEVVAFSAPTAYRKIKAGTFPKPVRLSERVAAWSVGDLRAWIQSQQTKGAV
jgi:predicted DNA-binding transcriptional regulator AlpA